MTDHRVVYTVEVRSAVRVLTPLAWLGCGYLAGLVFGRGWRL